MTNKKRIGIVSFLDVLGWKGIWVNHEDAIASLNQFVQTFQEFGDKLVIQYEKIGFKMVCFSDTIVIFTPTGGNDFETSLHFHVELCQWALENSLDSKYKLPLRGAIGYGEYYYSAGENTSILGPVVDEVSSWGDKADWIGVILAPSVRFELRFNNINIHKLKEIGSSEDYLIPFKENIKGLDLFVKWGDSNGVKLLENLLKNQRYTPLDATLKYLNTLSYLESKDVVTVEEKVKDDENLKVSVNPTDTYILKTGAILEFGDSYKDISSVIVDEVSIDSDSAKVTFYKDTSNRAAILKVGDSREFENFKISVKSVFVGTESSLVEFEVEWYQ